MDPLYSHVTNRTSLYAGYELRVSKIHTHISSTDRFKLLKLEKVPDISKRYASILEDSLFRLVRLSDPKAFPASFFFRETGKRLGSYRSFSGFLEEHIVPMTDSVSIGDIEIALKRTLFHGCAAGLNDGRILLEYVETMASSEDPTISDLGGKLRFHFSRGPMIFLAAESEPFSKSGGLANVVMQLPKSLAGLGEDARVITPIYGQGTEKSRRKMRAALVKYGVAYTGKTVSFTIEGRQYIVGIHTAMVEGVRFYLLDNHELFDGLYWGITSREKLVRRIGFARACAETILALEINPIFVFTNDAFAGLFGAIVRSDPGYSDHPVFKRASLLHIIHNGGWQYFDSFHRGESGRDLFPLFGLPPEKAPTFLDPVHNDRLNCMAAGVRSADRVITVSPSYARQIEVQCDGLEFLLSGVIGINNALNDDFERNARSVLEGSGFVEREFEVLVAHIVATPSLKKKVEQRYPEILEGWNAVRKVRDKDRQEICERMLLKLLLQAEQGLTVDPDLVLCCMIHRIADQKGFQLLLEASEGMFKTLGFQAIIGGIPASGDQRGEELARGCTQLQSYYPGRVATHIDFVDVSIPLLACDVFLMPSMSEPGGISQLEGMACGCIIVARSTGGLRDTVSPIRLEHSRYAGHGFLFTDYTTWAFFDSMHRCMEYFRDTGDTEILRARRDARKSVNTWDRSAKEYIRRMYSLREMIRPI